MGKKKKVYSELHAIFFWVSWMSWICFRHPLMLTKLGLCYPIVCWTKYYYEHALKQHYHPNQKKKKNNIIMSTRCPIFGLTESILSRILLALRSQLRFCSPVVRLPNQFSTFSYRPKRGIKKNFALGLKSWRRSTF